MPDQANTIFLQVYRGNLDTPGCPNVIVKISGNDAGAEAWGVAA